MKMTLLALVGAVLLLGACTQQQLEECDLSRSPMCMAMVGCVPQCDGRECGSDGCGGQCGTCEQFSLCGGDGQCQACDQAQLCLDKQCGPDGCGRLCGLCADNAYCQAGTCVEVCVPDCVGKGCGPDGCGGTCGECVDTFQCDEVGQCQPGELSADCSARPEPGCPNCAEGVEECVCKLRPECCTDQWEARCGYYAVYYCGGFCGERFEGCDGQAGEEAWYSKQCGQDEVGNSCGTCPEGQYCQGGASCMPVAPAIFGHECKKDVECLGGLCLQDSRICSSACFNTNDCPQGWFCRHAGGKGDTGFCEVMTPCWPACEGRDCGPDGCGGFCGECEDEAVCSAEGLCETKGGGCAPTPSVPGATGECAEAVCAADPFCCELGWDQGCVFICQIEDPLCGEPDFCDGEDCDGCKPSLEVGCSGCGCQDCVCALHPHCCLESWDRTCVEACRECGGNCK